MNARALVIAAAAMAAALWAAPAAAQERLFIAPLDAEGLTNVEQRIVGERVVSRVVAYQAFELISQEAVNDIIARTRQQNLLDGSCLGDTRCLSSLGKLLQSRYVLRPRAFAVSDEITVTVELLDIEGGRIVSKREYRTTRPMKSLGPDFESTLDEIVRPLKITGQLRLTAEAPGSVLVVQKREFKVNDERKLTLTFPVGSYGLELTHPAYVPVSERLFIPATGADWNPDQVTIEEANPKFYKRWWFWTAVGVVAVGSGVGLYYALKPEPEEKSPPAKRPYGTVTVRF